MDISRETMNMKGEARKYQEEGIDFLKKRARVILADEPGLGKTFQCLGALEGLGFGPTLIVCPKMALGVWEHEIRKWTDQIGMIYDGTQTQRKKLWKSFVEDDIPFLITNYAKLKELLTLKPSWKTIICDEYHLAGVRNRNTQVYDNLKRFTSTNMFLITGTPINRGPQDLFAPLSLLNPTEFKSYWGYEARYCLVIDGMFGKTIEERPKDPTVFKQMWSRYMIHRKKSVVDGLPDKLRMPVPLEMTSKQAKLYREIEENMYAEVKQSDLMIKDGHPNWDDEVIITPGRMSQILRLRQMLVTPQLLGINEKGAILEALPELLNAEFENGTPVMIFTPFAQAIPFIKEAIAKVAKQCWSLQGGMKGTDLHASVEAFQNSKEVRRVLICSIKTGASFTAHAASTAFFCGYEWSANDNLQAEDRIHRIGQSKLVRIQYLLHKHTVDELVMEKLDAKQSAADFILTRSSLKR
jgi:SNF2 family DNA or RNA helicase